MKKAAQAMEENNLSEEYSGALRIGIWDNCEILPPTATKNKANSLIFLR